MLKGMVGKPPVPAARLSVELGAPARGKTSWPSDTSSRLTIAPITSPGWSVRILSSQDAGIFVHIDRKSDILAFRERVPEDRVQFIEDRVPVYWGEFSMVQAILNTMSEALGRGHAFDYFCLLSGTDYPIRSIDYIEQFFLKHKGNEFINLVEIPNEAVGKPIERLTTYKIQTGQDGLWAKFIRRIRRLHGWQFQRDHKKYLKGLRPYGGSTWWALSREACEYALNFTRHHPRVVKFFRNTLCPDESFFHTIIGKSPFHPRVTRNLTFADWSRSPDSAHPAIIDQQHIHYFLASSAVMAEDAYGKGEMLFARKFPDDSESLIAQLHRGLEQGPLSRL